MHAVALLFDLHLPGCRSLKQKRHALRPVVEGLRHRFRVSVAEVGDQDRWQRSQVAVAVVAASGAHLDEVISAVERFVWSHPEVEVSSVQRGWLEVEPAW